MQSYLGTCIAIGNLKSAALYFDYVIPINLISQFTAGKGTFPTFPPDIGPLLKSLRDIIPPRFRDNEDFAKELALVNGKTTEILLSAQGYPALFEKKHLERVRGATDAIYTFIDRFGLGAVPLDCSSNLFEQSRDVSSPSTLLISLNLIDAEKAPWDAIIALREDLEAQDRLRRLRLFTYENYDEKPPGYVEDDILTRIYEYEKEAKRWGLEMTQSTLATVLSSKILGGSVAGSFLSALAGAPTIAVLSGLGLGTLELGRITVEVVKRRAALVDLDQQNPVSYISYAKRQLGKPLRKARTHQLSFARR